MNIIEFLGNLKKGEKNRQVFVRDKNNKTFVLKGIYVGDTFITLTSYTSDSLNLFNNNGELQYELEKALSNSETNKLKINIELTLFDSIDIDYIENSIGEIIIYEKKELLDKIKNIFN